MNQSVTNIAEKLERTCVPAMDAILGERFDVLDHGFIRVIDYMGDDSSVAQMARTSYGKGTKSVNEDRGLLRYLIRHRHTSPLEGNEIKLHIRMPIFVMRQWIRHRTANVNEYSMRYSEPSEDFYVPAMENIQLQSKDNKQGRGAEADENVRRNFRRQTVLQSSNALEHYEEFNEQGIARELNRINLPVSAYTECYWKIDLHNLLHFLSLRCDPHAQYEIRVYAEIILHQIVKVWCPDIYEAFVEFNLNSKSFSATEMDMVKQMVSCLDKLTIPHFKNALLSNGMSKREIDEFCNKVGVSDVS